MDGSGLVEEPLLDVSASVEIDPESGAQVNIVMSDGGISSTLVIYQDGSKLARFTDGTSIRTVKDKGE